MKLGQLLILEIDCCEPCTTRSHEFGAHESGEAIKTDEYQGALEMVEGLSLQ